MMCKKINKNKRGFSLVELMVVVAIMGTLAAIAIPAYNEYRKSAKKAAYRSDLNALHKGWLAFGVELDSFCERETEPTTASIKNVGMASIVNSKLYGNKDLSACYSSTETPAPTTKGACDTKNGVWREPVGPGKHNFLGFTSVVSGCNALSGVGESQLLGKEGSTATTAAADCNLDITTYDMGVYGHISGKEYFGVSIDNNGVLSGEHEGATGETADSNCA